MKIFSITLEEVAIFRNNLLGYDHLCSFTHVALAWNSTSLRVGLYGIAYRIIHSYRRISLNRSEKDVRFVSVRIADLESPLLCAGHTVNKAKWNMSPFYRLSSPHVSITNETTLASFAVWPAYIYIYTILIVSFYVLH